MRTLWILLAVAALALPASAQDDVSGVRLTASDVSAPIPYAGSGTIDTTVNVGCVELLQNPTVSTVTVSASAPSWFDADSATGTVSVQGCVNASGSVSVNVPLAFNVAPSAPGVLPQVINLTASFGSVTSEVAQPTITVEYYSNYTVVPRTAFPVEVTGGSATFEVAMTQNSNAVSMIMVQNTATDNGVFAGLGSVEYQPGQTRIFNATFTAPGTEWTNATVTFDTFGHYTIAGLTPGDLMDKKTYVWTFVNVDETTNGEDKKSPAPLALLALVGAALALRRKA